MSVPWRVVRLEGETSASWRKNHLVVEGTRVPGGDIAALVVSTPARISAGVVTGLAALGTPVVFCDALGRPAATSMMVSDSKLVATRHWKQAEMSAPARKRAWQALVREKVLGQASNLAEPERSQLKELAGSIRSGDPTNIEALAARIYWSALFGNDFRRRPAGGDPLNRQLNYGYAILRSSVIRSTFTFGLWPTYGIHHRHRSNGFCLADDLIEPLRPAVDWHLAQARAADEEAMRSAVSLLEGLNPDSGAHRVSIATDRIARWFASVLEGGSDEALVGWRAPWACGRS